jgi:transposase
VSRAYSADLRERVLDAVASGSLARSAALRFGIGVATAVRWVRRWRETGVRRTHRQGSPRRSVLDAHEAFLFALVEERSDITLDEMCARLRAERGVEAARVIVWRFFDRRGWSFKKRQAMRTSRRGLKSPRHAVPGSRPNPISIQSG